MMTAGGLALIACAALLFLSRFLLPKKQQGVAASHGGIAIGGNNSGDVRSIQSHSVNPPSRVPTLDVINIAAAVCSFVGLFLTIWGMVK